VEGVLWHRVAIILQGPVTHCDCRECAKGTGCRAAFDTYIDNGMIRWDAAEDILVGLRHASTMIVVGEIWSFGRTATAYCGSGKAVRITPRRCPLAAGYAPPSWGWRVG